MIIKRFTIIEIMFVVGILIILIGISMMASNKIIRKSAESQTKAEIKMIKSAIDAYKIRWGAYPKSKNDRVDFIEWLSNVSPYQYDSGSGGRLIREMYINARQANMNVTNKDYFMSGVHGVSAKDPYENYYLYSSSGNSFVVYSVGIDGKEGTADDVK